MPKYTVSITATAESDISEIFDYIARNTPHAAAGWVDEVERQIRSLERFPLRCPVIPESEGLGVAYRHLLYGKYRTIFRIEESQVIVLRVIHGARLLDLRLFEEGRGL